MQALLFSLNSFAVVIQIVHQLLLEVCHKFKFMCIKPFSLSNPKKFSMVALSMRLPLQFTPCRAYYFLMLTRQIRPGFFISNRAFLWFKWNSQLCNSIVILKITDTGVAAHFKLSCNLSTSRLFYCIILIVVFKF